jgi:ankyrin repeat protein
MFEAAVTAIIDGDEAKLTGLLGDAPELVRARSASSHRATLLHYVAANGVEDELQRTPANIVAITRILLAAGAEVDATADMYGGGCTPLALLVSSVHPHRAGVMVALVETLVEAGADVNGAGDPLLTALRFGYPDAAEALAALGARVETVTAAAGLGHLALLERLLAARTASSDELEQALVLACRLGQTEAVERLLGQGVDMAARDDQGFTGLHWAAWYGRQSTLEFLLARGAPLEAKNNYGGTVLESVMWARTNAGTGIDYAPIIERLIAAGAVQSVRDAS